MTQSTADELEPRLRELFERQAAGIDTSARVWDDAPMVRADEIAPRRRSPSALVAAVSVAAAVLLVVGIVAASPARDGVTVGSQPGATPTPAPVRVATPQVTMAAGAVLIDAEGTTFSPAGRSLDVHSDPGTPNRYTTLELGWNERGVDMRLFIYFASDGHDWWANEIRTYNGHAAGNWIYYDGTFFRTPLGSTYTGEVNLPATRGRGHLQLTGLRLRAFVPPAACEHAASKYALDIAYARVEMARGDAGFGLGAPRLLDTATCTPVADAAAYELDARVVDPGIAGLANYTLSPPLAADRGFNLGDSIDLAPGAAGSTILRITAHRRSDGTVVATADVPIRVG
jgi:hypothetical protein